MSKAYLPVEDQMKGLLRVLAALAALVAPLAHSANEEDVARAKVAAEAWLSLADAGDGAKTWQTAASYFQAAVSRENWQRSLAAARGPLGGVKSRTLKSAVFTNSLPGAPDGEYVVIQYATMFDNKASAIETVTPMKEKGGAWKVSGYYVR
jgi:hypothetical protein